MPGTTGGWGRLARYVKDAVFLELARWDKSQTPGAVADEDPAVRKLKVDADANLLRLMMVACKKERPLRVLELCQLLSLPSSWDGALKVALHAKMIHVAERIAQMKDAALANNGGSGGIGSGNGGAGRATSL